MGKKITGWKTKGMNRDMSVSAYNAEFAFENINLRLSTNDNNTTMSWVNERGPLQLTLTIDTEPWITTGEKTYASTISGIPIGTAVINHKLVLFTTQKNASKPDSIYVLWYDGDEKTHMQGKIIYKGNLNFNTDYPLETLVSYEAEHIQKVYWTDGLNQPKMINIAADEGKLSKWNTSGQVEDYFFDFVPSANFQEEVSVRKNVSSMGLFAPGIIQYCFTYVNKNGQQSNIIWLSSLYYLSHNDRGASPEEKVTNSFEITIQNADTNFDFVRLYSIQRTSLNDVPFVKLLTDIEITGNALTYVDNGTTGSNMDPTELLYIGGREVTALTMADKDQTLFLGNLTQPNSLITDIQNYFDSIRGTAGDIEISFKNDGLEKHILLDHSYGVYGYTNLMNKGDLRQISTFKGGETYRFGFQLQKKTGEWSEPIYLNDVVNDKYPNTAIYRDTINLPYAQATLDISDFADRIDDFYDTYKRIRPLVVFPTIGDRTVLCQGVLNPTVFNANDRTDNSPYAQASWYFRPYMASQDIVPEDVDLDDNIPITQTTLDPSNPDIGVEDSYFTDNNLIKSTYVLVATLQDYYQGTSDLINTILSRGYLRGVYKRQVENNEPTLRYADYRFTGAIDLGNNKYAFFRDEQWVEPYSVTEIDPALNKNVTTSYEYLDGIILDGIETTAFSLYNGMSLTNKNLYYYKQRNDQAPVSYVFKFYANGQHYRVTYTSVAVEDDYAVSTENTDGIPVRFKHYDSLYSSSEANNARDLIKRVEIQGSVNNPASPFTIDTSEQNVGPASRHRPGSSINTKSNTQFFIDQSIVTLNSPDIEFDTEVQTYGTEGLKLRVIGAIPITANVSAHSIETSSAMMEIERIGRTTNHFGSGEVNYNVLHNNIDVYAGRRLVAEFLWNDSFVEKEKDDDTKEYKYKAKTGVFNYPVFPWHRKGSLNNDTRTEAEASSVLSKKKESNLLYSINTEYFPSSAVNFSKLNSQIILTENAQVMNYRLPRQKTTSSEINYYPNIDKVLYNEDGYDIITFEGDTEEKVTSPISMKYKSTSHAIIALDAPTSDSGIPILPYGSFSGNNVGLYENPTGVEEYRTFWGDTGMFFSQAEVDMSNMFMSGQTNIAHNFLWIGELYKNVLNRFGGRTKEALRTNNWLPAGDVVNLPTATDNDQTVTLNWTEGDTFYQRYDCLKTYAFTPEDTNQIIEILSFMCETHINIDGRYDRNRGQADNTNMSPRIFNILNPVYSQQDNFFTAKKLDTDNIDKLSYPNQISYSKTKQSGADVDIWTNVTLASTLEMDGDKGQVTSLNRFNNQLLAFQDTGIAHILYNENTQISTTEGVPIELANSGKVQGKRYISDTIGCSNKWSVVTTPSGIYFMDSNDKSIYLFNGQLSNVSLNGGFNTWAKQNIPSSEIPWNPVDFDNFKAYYDKLNQDVLFTNKETTLAFSERMNAFTSFYDYGNTPYLSNLDDTGVWVRNNGTLYKHNAGEYCNFFGENKPYSTTLIGNPEPQADKIFTNLEFRACVDGDGTYNSQTEKFTPTLPFDSLETWNEYQHGITELGIKNGIQAMMHHTLDDISTLKRKFRMWRCDIPRDNALLSSDAGKNITRFKVQRLNRMRNPWLYLKLEKNAGQETMNRTEIHDVLMTYFS